MTTSRKVILLCITAVALAPDRAQGECAAQEYSTLTLISVENETVVGSDDAEAAHWSEEAVLIGPFDEDDEITIGDVYDGATLRAR